MEFNCQSLIEMLHFGDEGILRDFIYEDGPKGLEIVANVIAPPVKTNVIQLRYEKKLIVNQILAQQSVGIWRLVEAGIKSSMLAEHYRKSLVSVLQGIVTKSNITELQKIIQSILKKIY